MTSRRTGQQCIRDPERFTRACTFRRCPMRASRTPRFSFMKGASHGRLDGLTERKCPAARMERRLQAPERCGRCSGHLEHIWHAQKHPTIDEEQRYVDNNPPRQTPITASTTRSLGSEGRGLRVCSVINNGCRTVGPGITTRIQCTMASQQIFSRISSNVTAACQTPVHAPRRTVLWNCSA